MNKVIITGRLTKEPELRFTQSNKAVCTFDLATNRPVMRDGERVADFIRVVSWGVQAENLQKYQSKGSLIAVEGSIRTENYKDDKGNTRYRTYVLANNIEYLESKKKDTDTPVEEPTGNPYEEFGQQIAIDESDLPF